ncbi:MAG: cation diffusion facilitator family transporter [Loktanella sp.]|jgi:ferrous-iron efflux pump FieF|nr:cation diffusion facilitator family transporter [Loktanella sp.]MDO7609138.1 cation diffusion facilitator family transporter [Loktanella sp.]MDO7622691.1 cation diffusion facilitator family transporter [Loktanella sp.]MDO7626114.1 cation diffusion facilitator family transporter [Loktanella sp.]MDO7666312.1 cation diffusion facilitator family transporter [Loktanella sp.]
MNTQSETRLNLSAGLLSVTVALVLVIAKLWAFGETGSLSIAATLADSAMDLMMSLGGLVAIIYAAKPADDDHNFGHTSAEDLAALGQSIFILISATVIAVAAILRLLDRNVSLPEREASGMVVIVFSIVITIALVLWQRRVAKQTGNRVVAADSLHYLGDLIPNVGALIALWASAKFGIGQIDSIVALAAAALLAFGAMRIGKAAFDALMDRQADTGMIAGIEDITRDFEGVHGFHDLKTRVAGSRVFVNLHIELDGTQTLEDAHAIGAALRRAITEAYPRADVLIHKDPVGVEKHPDDQR